MNRSQVKALVPAILVLLVLLFGVFWFFSNKNGTDTDVAVKSIADFARSLLLLCIFTGICAMATIQFVVRMFPVRGLFHRKMLKSLAGAPAVVAIVGYDALDPRRFDLPVGVLMAQLSAAADSEFDRLKGRVRQADRSALPASPPDDLASGSPLIYALIRRRREPVESAEWEALEVRVNASIDDIQALLEYDWHRQVRMWASVTSALYGFGSLLVVHVGPGAKFIALVATAVIGGFFAWLARDVAALAEKKPS